VTQKHTYIRYDSIIYVGDVNDNWRQLHNFHSERRARRWQRDQEKKRPGSVTVGKPPQKLFNQSMELAAQKQSHTREVARLIIQQAADRARDQRLQTSRYDSGPSGKTAQLAQAYVAPDRDGSSYLRERSKKRVKSRNARNTRATYGGS
jgi:hypothetical protein